MKSVLSLDETPSALERSFKTATKLSRELPTDLGMESMVLENLSVFAKDIYIKTQETSQNIEDARIFRD